MSRNSRILTIFDVVLRVPPLFVLDSILNRSFLTWWFMPDSDDEESILFDYYFFASIFILLICFLGSVVILSLGTNQIVDIYSFLTSLGIILLSYFHNQLYIDEAKVQLEDLDNVWELLIADYSGLIQTIFVQLFFAFSYNTIKLQSKWSGYGIFYSILTDRYHIRTYVCFLQPVICILLDVPAKYWKWVPLFSSAIMISELKFILMTQAVAVVALFRRTYLLARYMLQTYGIMIFLETQWNRLHVPNVLRVFFLSRVLWQIGYWTYMKVTNEIFSGHLTVEDCLDIGRTVLMGGCDTVVAILGMTSVVAFVTHYIGIAIAIYIGSEKEEDRNMGTMSAILFFILALQTGLTGLHPDHRMVRLYRNICLLSTAILHFVHSMVNPILMTLSASGNPSVMKHFRALSMCFILIVFPAWFLYYLWSQHSTGTWLLAVTAFSIEVMVKVFISLLIYVLFMIDASRDCFWEKLDDYVYYIKSVGNSVEFLFGIFLFCNGAWIMLFESGGTIRAFMMCIHAYFNIWVQAKDGWKVFMKRRSAVNKINSLPEATEAELRNLDDVCAICYQELTTARVTRCHHFFHGVCLRKWLYIKDRCPMCHELIYNPNVQSEAEPPGNAQHPPEGEARPDINNGQIHHQHHD